MCSRWYVLLRGDKLYYIINSNIYFKLYYKAKDLWSVHIHRCVHVYTHPPLSRINFGITSLNMTHHLRTNWRAPQVSLCHRLYAKSGISWYGIRHFRKLLKFPLFRETAAQLLQKNLYSHQPVGRHFVTFGGDNIKMSALGMQHTILIKIWSG